MVEFRSDAGLQALGALYSNRSYTSPSSTKKADLFPSCFVFVETCQNERMGSRYTLHILVLELWAEGDSDIHVMLVKRFRVTVDLRSWGIAP